MYNRLHEQRALAAWREANPDGWGRVVSLLTRGYGWAAWRLALALYGPEAVEDLRAMEETRSRVSYPGRWDRPPLTRWGKRPEGKVAVRCRACGGWGEISPLDGPPLAAVSCAVCDGAGVVEV